MSLATYKKKRDFSQTSEPAGKKLGESSFRFVVQKHQATRLHYDFRLELGGVLKSWAVPKGPSLDPADKRLAVQTEDHPVDYIDFKGIIPKGNYGAGKVEIWDNGKFVPVDGKHQPISEKAALLAMKKGELKVLLKGKKLKGEFVLVRMKDEKNWLLIKHKDAESTPTKEAAPVASIRHGKGVKLEEPVKPMLASIEKMPFDDKDWIFELKWDGYRAIAEIKSKGNRLYSRNGIDLQKRFPPIQQHLQKIKHDCILDGEIVLLNEHNLPDFQKLQNYESNTSLPLIFYVFDILSLSGKNMEELPLIDRKKILKKLLPKDPVIKYCDHVEERGIEFFELAREKGLEGVIAKKSDSSYSRGYRSKQWLKIKNVQSSEAVIVGFTEPKGSREHFGSLILAGKKGKAWQYRGHVGTGFNANLLKSIKAKLAKLHTDVSPFKEKIPLNGVVTWVKPKLVADIGYTELTSENIFRHPVFLRLRDDKPVMNLNEEILPEEPETKTHKGVALTNQQKVFWPDEGYTKGDLINYYATVAEFILPHLKDRPMSLKRNPNGIKDEGFYHKDAGENAPSFVKVFPVQSESSNKVIDYIVCNNQKTLLYLANLGCIEMNPWNSRTQKPDNPTWLSIDIDPSEKNTFKEVVDVALVVKEICESAKLTSYCKTSGASGLHVYIPLKNKYDYETVRNFAKLIAGMVQEKLPDTTSIVRSLKKRGNKIYIDFLQNRSGQTLASVYSLRPIKGAQVSAALEWKEVNHNLSPAAFTIRSMPARLKKKGDLFAGVLTDSNDLSKALRLLEK